MIRPHRTHPLWFAFILHRISGLLLAVFLPFHFYVLSLALTERQRFEDFILWVDHPMVKFAEFGLVFLLAVHFFGGLRLLALEFLPWSPRQKTFAALSLAGAFLLACLFLLSATA
ncbi:MAG: succinate dehydrogenase, cytochrome b556 subunit [Granulosicoccus sp.]|nr:succinate dehydrogenase, cytochrome b556 subunit [Granulosicoccus sp.]